MVGKSSNVNLPHTHIWIYRWWHYKLENEAKRWRRKNCDIRFAIRFYEEEEPRWQRAESSELLVFMTSPPPNIPNQLKDRGDHHQFPEWLRYSTLESQVDQTELIEYCAVVGGVHFHKLIIILTIESDAKTTASVTISGRNGLTWCSHERLISPFYNLVRDSALWPKQWKLRRNCVKGGVGERVY